MRESIPKFRRRDLMELPEGKWLCTNVGEFHDDSGTFIPIAVIHLPGEQDTQLREEIWSEYKDCISGRMIHCFDNESEMVHFCKGTGVEP